MLFILGSALVSYIFLFHTKLRRKLFFVRRSIFSPFPRRKPHGSNEEKWTIIWQSPKGGLVEEEWVRSLFSEIETEDFYDVDNGRSRYSEVRDRSIVVIAANNNDQYKRIYDYIKKFKGLDFILIHLSDESLRHKTSYYKFAPLVLRQYYSADANKQNVRVIPLGHINGMTPFDYEVQKKRKYIWSFAGEVSRHKPHRFKMIECLKILKPNYYFLTDDFGKSIKQGLNSREYSDLLSDSVFVPSPMGNCNLDCFRIYESLSMGAIPIVVGSRFKFYKNLSYLSSPVIRKSNWDDASREIKYLSSNPDILVSIQKEHGEWWKKSIKHLKSEIRVWCKS